MNYPIKILHITGHLGGGVGTVVLNYLVHKSSDASQRHSVISLDYLNSYATDVLSSVDIEYSDRCHARIDHINSKIREADIVLLHWWNHPLITDLLVRKRLEACRLVLWSHISGSPAPNNFTRKIFGYPDELIFTTPLSYFDPEFVDLPERVKDKVGSIWSTGGVERLKGYSPIAHDGFNIGYVGNLDFTKIHPEFVEICNMVDIPDVRFTVVGPLNDELSRKVEDAGLTDRIRFTGFVSEEEKWAELCRFDLFGYPLARHHYGTCDQTLQEAMAVGIVPIVLDNPMESYIVKDGRTGLVARSVNEYVDCLHTLYRDKQLRNRFAEEGRKQAFSEYSLEGLSANWDAVFNRLITLDRQEKFWPDVENASDLEPHEVFLESLGRYGGVFTEFLKAERVSNDTAKAQLESLGSRQNWTSDNKSTVHQFATFFPDDMILAEWSSIMRGGKES